MSRDNAADVSGDRLHLFPFKAGRRAPAVVASLISGPIELKLLFFVRCVAMLFRQRALLFFARCVDRVGSSMPCLGKARVSSCLPMHGMHQKSPQFCDLMILGLIVPGIDVSRVVRLLVRRLFRIVFFSGVLRLLQLYASPFRCHRSPTL